MKAKELQAKSQAELTVLEKDLKKEQFNLRMQSGVQGAVKPHLIKAARRNVARIKTILTQKGAK